MKISISIMAHPSREKYFEYLTERLDGAPFSVDEGWGLLENAKRSWLLYDDTADYHIVIQDDAILCDNFIEKARAAIEQNNGMIVSFYHANRSQFETEVKKALENNGVIIKQHIHSALAMAIPTNRIKEMIAYFETLDNPQDDVRIGLWAKHAGIKNAIIIPSLVDHRADPSLHKNNQANKYTKAFIFIDNYENK